MNEARINAHNTTITHANNSAIQHLEQPAIVTAATDLTAPAISWRNVMASYIDTRDSAATKRAYVSAIEEALTAIGVTSLEELNGAQLAAWRADLAGRPLAPSTVSLRLAALRSFLTWAQAMGACRLPAEVVAVALRTPRGDVRRPYQVLSEPEVAAMLAAATTPRDVAILAVMLGGGLRVGELVALDVDDVIEDADGGMVIHVMKGKGNKSRSVPVRPDVAGAVRSYLAASTRTVGQGGPLFRSHDRGELQSAPGRA